MHGETELINFIEYYSILIIGIGVLLYVYYCALAMYHVHVGVCPCTCMCVPTFLTNVYTLYGKEFSCFMGMMYCCNW